jgi:carbon monoxide dehydrogenase subunit G
LIKIAERVPVPHSPQVVWDVLSDPATVVSCIDGSELGEEHEDGTFDARLAVKFAAIKVAFAARVGLELDEDARVGRMEAQGADSRGSTRVGGHATFTVVPTDAGSEVALDGVIEITGQLASLVTTGATVVVDRMTRSFGTQLTATCAERDPATPAPDQGGTVSTFRARDGLGARLRRAWQRLRDSWSTRRTNRSIRKADA